MMFHTLFVVLTFLGIQIKWTTQNQIPTNGNFRSFIALSLYGWLTYTLA